MFYGQRRRRYVHAVDPRSGIRVRSGQTKSKKIASKSRSTKTLLEAEVQQVASDRRPLVRHVHDRPSNMMRDDSFVD